ncbi:MAG: alginate lyase family protein [Anaerolinea sp.]|nr:alginate lyase family protein [Anaerolinea sp.]
MTFRPIHAGLTFTEDHINSARRNRDREPFRATYLMLNEREQTGASSAQWDAFRYRFTADERAGEHGIETLMRHIDEPLSEDVTYLASVAETFMLTQTFELLRGHPAFRYAEQVRFMNTLGMRVSTLSASPYKDTQVENLWMALAVMAAGVSLEREEIFTLGVEVFERTIRDDVSPRGYVNRAIEGKDGGSLYRQILSSAALVLMAEIGTHAGVDLWNFAVRGVSVTTTAIYPIYYFYTPEKWEWDAGITQEEAQMLFRRYGGYLEIVNRRTQHRDLKPVLEDLRPIYDPHGGGLTTLTHGVPIKRGLFG